MVTISQRGYPVRIHDPSSNKCVIFICTDAVLVFGYTGLAYLDRTPTDQWIAQELWGAPIGEDDSGTIPMIGGRRPGFARVNQVLLSLRRKLKETRGGAQVEIAAVGYRFRRGRFQPVLIAFTGRDAEVRSSWMTMRPPIDSVGREGIIGFQPTDATIAEARSEAPTVVKLNELQLAEHIASIHASTIRKAAGTTATVGAHVMKVLIPTSHHRFRGRGPWQRRIVCQFDPHSAGNSAMEAGATAWGAPSAFAPWVVTDFGFQPASLMGGMGIMRDFKGWKVELSQVRPDANLGPRVFTAQPRPPLPS
jgi:hypothetical protein